MDEKKIVEAAVDGADVILQDNGIDMMAKIVKKAKSSGTAIGFGIGILTMGVYYKLIKPAVSKVMARRKNEEVEDDVVEETVDAEE